MNKEYLDLIYENEGEEVVEDATVFNDEWADWYYVKKKDS